ncbi:MAG TPA: division initiation protein, partial [Clostridium sp.]|nr:division initiation protein [Clostridium sp.]
MKKFSYQIAIALIFLLLGYMLTTQISTINKQTISTDEEKANPEIIIENEHLRKQKEQLEKQIDDLNAKAKEFEEAAAGRTEESTLLL